MHTSKVNGTINCIWRNQLLVVDSIYLQCIKFVFVLVMLF